MAGVYAKDAERSMWMNLSKKDELREATQVQSKQAENLVHVAEKQLDKRSSIFIGFLYRKSWLKYQLNTNVHWLLELWV